MGTCSRAVMAAVLSLLASDVSYGATATFRSGRPRRNPDGTDLQRLQFNNPEAVVPLHHAVFGGFFVQDWDKDGQPDICTYCWPSDGDWCWCGIKMYSSSKAVSGKGTDRVYPKGEWIGELPPRDGVRGPGYWPAGKPFDLRNQSIHRPKGKEGGYGGIDSFSVRGDLNGDGFEDRLVFCNDRTAYGWHDNFNEKGVWLNPHHCFGYVMWGKKHTKESPTNYCDPVALTGLNGQQMLFSGGVSSGALADFDGDGDLDLLTIEAPDLFLYRENVGTKKEPLFALPRDLVDAAGRRLSTRLCFGSFTLSDYDGDGRKDILAMDEESGVCWFRRTGLKDGLPVYDRPKDLMQQADELYFGDMSTPYAVDIDGDGDEDIVTGNASGEIAIIENLSGKGVEFPKWAAPKKITTPDGKEFRITAGVNGSIQGPQEAKYGYTITTAADWDGDGLVDILFNTIWGKILWMRNIGSKTAPRFDFPRGIEVEWKGDQPELPWGWFKPKTQENPKEIITQWRTTPVPVDWNGDGLVDLILCDTDGDFAFWERVRDKATGALKLLPPKKALCNPDGSPVRASRPVAKGEWLGGRAGSSGRRKLAVLDWNGDGRLDLVMNFEANMQVYLQEKSERGKWYFKCQPGWLAKEPLYSHDPAPGACDFNGDGRPDLLFGAMDGYIYYLRNPLSGAKVRVVLPPDASLSQKTAATELRDYCRKMGIASGTIELKTDESLGESGYALETVGDRLVISGSRARGCLNGAYGYLQDDCGVEWLSSWCECVPHRTELPQLAKKETHQPSFEVRDSFWRDIIDHQRFGARLRLNKHSFQRVDPAFGPDLNQFDGVLGECHTYKKILDQDVWFKEHPEWFSEVNGQRKNGQTQLCTTNPEVLKRTIAKVFERIEANPAAKYFGVDPNDCYFYCECAKCKAINDREGTAGGATMDFINRVAEAVSAKYPDKFVKISAYQYTAVPPKTFRIHKNVFLDLSPIDGGYLYPKATSTLEGDVKTRVDMAKWRAISDGEKIMNWDYAMNFHQYLLPFANVPSIQPNLQYWKSLGGTYEFVQGDNKGCHGEFAELKGWLVAQLLWDVEADVDRLIDRFMKGYYGPAAKTVRAYYDFLNAYERSDKNRNRRVGCGDEITSRPELLDDDFLVPAAKFWRQAEADVANSPAFSYNVRMSSMPIDYLLYTKYAKHVNLTRDSGAFTRGLAAARRLSANLKEAEAAGREVSLAEDSSVDKRLLPRIHALATGRQKTLGDGNRVRIGARDIARQGFLEQAHTEKRDGAFDGSVMCLNNDNYGWLTSYNLDQIAFDPGVRYALRVRFRAKATGKTGEVFQIGVCNNKDDSYPVRFSVDYEGLKEKDGFAWYEVGSWVPREFETLYFAPGWFDTKKFKLCPQHNGIEIDCFEIVREQK